MTTHQKVETAVQAYFLNAASNSESPLNFLITNPIPAVEEQTDVKVPFTPGPRIYGWKQMWAKASPCLVVAAEQSQPHPSPVLSDMGFIVIPVTVAGYTEVYDEAILQGITMMAEVQKLLNDLQNLAAFLNPPTSGPDNRSVMLYNGTVEASFSGLVCPMIKLGTTSRGGIPGDEGGKTDMWADCATIHVIAAG